MTIEDDETINNINQFYFIFYGTLVEPRKWYKKV